MHLNVERLCCVLQHILPSRLWILWSHGPSFQSVFHRSHQLILLPLVVLWLSPKFHLSCRRLGAENCAWHTDCIYRDETFWAWPSWAARAVSGQILRWSVFDKAKSPLQDYVRHSQCAYRNMRGTARRSQRMHDNQTTATYNPYTAPSLPAQVTTPIHFHIFHGNLRPSQVFVIPS